MDNNLKKEFAPKDVQRMRNLITGNVGDKTQLQTGWEKNHQRHKEGDIWEENGKEWTIKNGLKQTITKLDSLKKLVVLPLCCPKCNKLMQINNINKKMWGIHKMCFDCVIDMEAAIKREGKWEEYESKMMNANKDAQLIDLEAILDEWVDQKDTFVSESGEVETWNGGDKKEIYKQVKEQIQKLKNTDIYKKES